jgi:hypothetical protein
MARLAPTLRTFGADTVRKQGQALVGKAVLITGAAAVVAAAARVLAAAHLLAAKVEKNMGL